MPFTASARRVAGTWHDVIIEDHHHLVVDEPLGQGGFDLGPAPEDLLPASLAACIATTVELFAHRRAWPLESVEVDVSYDDTVHPAHFDVLARVSGALSPEQVAMLERVAESCPIRRALEAGFSFDEHVVAEPPDPRGH